MCYSTKEPSESEKLEQELEPRPEGENIASIEPTAWDHAPVDILNHSRE